MGNVRSADNVAGARDADYPATTWGTGEGIGAHKNPTGRGHTLDPRTRVAPPVGGDIKPRKKSKKARSSITPW